MSVYDFIYEFVRQLPGILEGLAYLIGAVLFPAAIVKATKAHSAAASAIGSQKGNRNV